MMMCSRCHKRIAVVFITKVENNQKASEGLCLHCAKELGLPEAAIPLSNAVCILATAPKSNSSYLAYHAACEDMNAGRGVDIPTHLKSPLFKGYKYPHDYENHYVEQRYLPLDIADKTYYHFGSNKTEQTAKAYLDFIKKKR